MHNVPYGIFGFKNLVWVKKPRPQHLKLSSPLFTFEGIGFELDCFRIGLDLDNSS